MKNFLENFSWLQASAAFGILSTILSGGGLILYLIADIKFQTKLKRRLRWKLIVLILVVLSGKNQYIGFCLLCLLLSCDRKF